MFPHKQITKIVVYSTAITSMGFFSYMFIIFLFGYTMTFEEPNKIIALVELILCLISIILITKMMIGDLNAKS